MPLSSPAPGSRSASFSSAPSRIPNLHPPQASMPPPTLSFSADGLTSHFRGKNRRYQAGTTQLPTVPAFPLCPTHSSGPSLKNKALAPEQSLPKPHASACVLGAQSLQASPAPVIPEGHYATYYEDGTAKNGAIFPTQVDHISLKIHIFHPNPTVQA